MSDIIHKILDIDDIFRYFTEFLNFDDKIVMSKLINKKLVKNIDIFNKKINQKNLSELYYICGECSYNLVNDMYYTLYYKYKDFLHNDDRYDDIYDDYDDDKNEIEFIYNNCYCIAVKAFLEIMDSQNIILNITNDECIYHLELDQNIYFTIYDKMQSIYENGINNNLLNVFCEKCANFGHCSLSNKCILYNKVYAKKEIKYNTIELIDDIINDVYNIIKRKKIMEKKNKYLCKSCKIYFYKRKCENKLCGRCCNCSKHSIKKLKI